MDLEQKTLLDELTRGKELACLLRQHLHPCSSTETPQLLLQKLLCSYEKALSMLNSSGFEVESKLWVTVLGSPASLSGSSDGVKKRKISSMEVPLDDGYCWRKYGQKDILGYKFPRGYYRCTHRHSRGCLATKQVQRSDNDPTILEVKYKGRHTCNKASHFAAPPLTAEEKLKQNANGTEDSNDRRGIFPSFSFQFESEEVENGLFVETLMSPATSDLTEIMSAPTSVTNSPIGDLDLKELDRFEFDPNFPFDENPEFFS
ncbi:hypothetical protein V6N11_041734 [Hibiscus sabdariffa]|uniref:WRKY domain-containing protein n=1 Tax=Hibiscus sabdariffa TaxID=183260 RepID=A0ABR2RL99_9ROSI